MLRVLSAYLGALLVTYVCATFAQTQHVMSRLADLGVNVTAGDRFAASFHDLLGMATSFLPIIALGLAIAFPVAAVVARGLPRWRAVAFPLAGGAALLAIHVILEAVFEITPVAAARTTLGLTVQALCGALGGWVFARGLRSPAARSGAPPGAGRD